MEVYISHWIQFSFALSIYPELELLDCMIDLCLNFEETIFFSIVLGPITFPSAIYKSSLFTTSSSAPVVSCLEDSHSNRCEVISYCGFNLHSLIVKIESLSMYPLATLMSFLEKCLFNFYVHLKSWVACFLLWIWLNSLYFGYQSLASIWCAKSYPYDHFANCFFCFLSYCVWYNLICWFVFFHCFCFWCRAPKIIAEMDTNELFLLNFFLGVK